MTVSPVWTAALAVEPESCDSVCELVSTEVGGETDDVDCEPATKLDDATSPGSVGPPPRVDPEVPEEPHALRIIAATTAG